MTSTIDQPALFTFDVVPAEPERVWCNACHSNWGLSLAEKVLTRISEEHRQVAPGRCAHMVQHNITEPYYDRRNETPWESGWVCQYPRPRGFGGLYQLARQ